MIRLEASVLINRRAEDIFAFLTVAENHPKFVPGMLEFTKISPGPFGQVGTTVHAVSRMLGRRMELSYEITGCEFAKELAMKARMGPLRFEDGYALHSLGGRTRVRFWLELSLTGLAKLALPFVRLIGKTHAGETVDKLKETLETGA